MLKSLRKYTVLGLLAGLTVTSAGCANLTAGNNITEEPPAQEQAETVPSEQHEGDAANDEAAEIEIIKLMFEPGSSAAAVLPNSRLELNLLAELKDGNVINLQESDYSGHIEFFIDADWAYIDDEGKLTISEQAPSGHEAVITASYGDYTAETRIIALYALEDTLETVSGAELPVVTNASSIAVIVNKQRSLQHNYAPDDLVIPEVEFFIEEEDQKKYLRKPAADALESLFAAAKEDGIHLVAVSGYRSYERQRSIFEYNVQTQGEERARRFSAMPGTSEHQTGLAMDISSREFGNRLDQEFGETDAGKWVAENSHKFGFIIRYPEGKEEITGYAYEPWHLRYVGIPLAENITASGLTMEEYFSQAIPVSAESAE